MSVLKEDIVDCKFVSIVDKLDPVTVEKVERPVCTSKILPLLLVTASPIVVERVDRPVAKVEKFKLIIVLKVDIVDCKLVF